MTLAPCLTLVRDLASGTRLRHGAALVALLAAVACSPKIGDECSISTDCSSTGDRLCDTTQPAGYCTIFNCEPGSCPDESVCIGFRGGLASTCQDAQVEPRFQRLFCMATCDGNADCRSGYDCIDMGTANNDYGAEVLESSGSHSKVCAVQASSIDGNAQNGTEVCSGTSDESADESAEDEGG